jgi:hypothetical protein
VISFCNLDSVFLLGWNGNRSGIYLAIVLEIWPAVWLRQVVVGLSL